MPRPLPRFRASALGLGLLLAAALARPRAQAAAPSEAPPDPMMAEGVVTHFAQGWDRSLIAPIAAAGLRTVRDEIYWQAVEPKPGHYVFPRGYDRTMAALRSAEISPLIELDFANTHYDHGLTPYTPEGIAAYARYGVAVLRHYGPQIKAVEIWNEYNGTFCRGPAADHRSASYVAMLKASYAALKAERPDLIVVGGATAGLPLPYLQRLFDLGALDAMDAVSIHPYRYDAPPEGIENGIAALQELIRRASPGHPKPIWVTEISWGVKPAAAPGDLAIDPATQAAFLVRAYALLLSAGVERIYWYPFLDDWTGPALGLVARKHTEPKPAYFAMKTLISAIGGARCLGREPTPPDLYAVRFERPGGETTRILWDPSGRTISLPAACRSEDMEGHPLAPGPFALGGAPIFVSGPALPLPAPDPDAPRLIADSVRDFSDRQGGNGWSYGVFVGRSSLFVPLRRFTATDWTREWYGDYRYLDLTDQDQHPSVAFSGPVAAVRRWSAPAGETVRVGARFQCGQQGDGVTVAVLEGGRRLFSARIGGRGNPAVARFDSRQTLPPGGSLDFAVYPAPDENINYSATSVAVTITQSSLR